MKELLKKLGIDPTLDGAGLKVELNKSAQMAENRMDRAQKAQDLKKVQEWKALLDEILEARDMLGSDNRGQKNKTGLTAEEAVGNDADLSFSEGLSAYWDNLPTLI